MHDQPVDDPAEAVEHVVEREERVRNHDPLRRGVRDVALVPERDVLQADDRGAANYAREPGDPLGDLGVPLVRHRRRALHPGCERLLDLAHLRAGEVPDLGREPIERRGRERERREQLCMPVTRDHLGRDRLGLEAEPVARDALDLGVDRRVRSDGSRELADAALLERPPDAVACAVELERPAGELPAEGRRLGVDPVRAADADRVAVLLREPNDRGERGFDPMDDQTACVADLQSERGVDHVRGRQAVVEPPALGADLLGHRVDERCEVVVGCLFDLGDTLGCRRCRAAANRRNVRDRDDSQLGPSVQRSQLHLEPAHQLALLRPNPAHLRTGVAGDHSEQCRAGSGERDDACGEHRGVLRVVDADRRDRDSGRHLDD